MWDGFVLGRVRLLKKVSIGALDDGVITSGLVIRRIGTGLVFRSFGAYVFAMALGFCDTALWPLVSSAAGCGQRSCQV